jgi:diadenosine tetraphosphate (Ap4A) HIT family hydrolase
MDGRVKPAMTPMCATAWPLDPQLARDTAPVGDLPLARVLLNNDCNYPWLILVPRRAGLIDLIDLADDERAQLMTEVARASRVLKDITRCHKLNVAALGNVVAQLHVHVIARQKTDAAWPNPVWGVAPRRPYEPAERERLIGAIRRGLQIAPDRD